jgi:hypothetical protein
MGSQILTKNLLRVHNRGLLLSILEKEALLTRITVFADGCFSVDTQDWNTYWQPVYKLGERKIEVSLDAFYTTWRKYINARFVSSQSQEFCYQYFSLLENLLSFQNQISNPIWLRALKLTLGFECCEINSMNTGDEALAAGTFTLLNPCYLLTKIKIPKMLDDPQFLPVITTGGADKLELFYHYRQYSLSQYSPMSLFLYPAVSLKKRSASFKLINSFVGGFKDGTDPRTGERAQRLLHHIIQPILEACEISKTIVDSIEMIDVGAGSGGLTSIICSEILDMGFKPKFQFWFVDLDSADTTKFFRNKRLQAYLDNFTFLIDSYRSWLSKPQPLPQQTPNSLRFALVSKLFNNLSSFSIRYVSDKELFPMHGNIEGYLDLKNDCPSFCLSQKSGGVNDLLISKTRVQLYDGRTFPLASLSEFYHGLYLLSAKDGDNSCGVPGFFLPIRSFNSTCLETTNGQSIISSLANICDYVIIEDADLRQQDLVAHATKFSLHFLTICDMTKAMKLKGNYVYVIWLKCAINPILMGEHIW